jgi:hypothetical protein
LEFAFRRALERMSARFAAEPSQANLESFAVAASLLGTLPFTVNLWQVQNRFHGMLKGVYAARNKEIGEAARRWIRGFEELGHKLGIKVP